MDDCIFCKLASGEIPCEKVYEDDQALAFVDLHPLQPGHILVIPKKHYGRFEEMDDETYDHVFKVVKKGAQKISQTLKPARVCSRIEGFDVNHVHIHIYPCSNAQEFYGDKDRMNNEPDHTALSAMAERLKF